MVMMIVSIEIQSWTFVSLLWGVLWHVVIAAKLSKLPRIISTAPVRRCGLSTEIKTSKCSNSCPSVSSATAAETFFLMGSLRIEGAPKMFHSVFPLFAKDAAVFIFHSVFNGEIRQNLPGCPKSTQKWEKSVQLFYPHTHTHPLALFALFASPPLRCQTCHCYAISVCWPGRSGMTVGKWMKVNIEIACRRQKVW